MVTLVPDQTAQCLGLLYTVEPGHESSTRSYLDVREQGGYLPRNAAVLPDNDQALFYVAEPNNPNFLGPSPLPQLVAQILAAHGPSGPNLEYVLKLHWALQKHGIVDAHISEIAAQLQAS